MVLLYITIYVILGIATGGIGAGMWMHASYGAGFDLTDLDSMEVTCIVIGSVLWPLVAVCAGAFFLFKWIAKSVYDTVERIQNNSKNMRL